MAREMKDSGIEWIGDIPSEWYLPKIKNLFTIGRGRVISQLELEDSGYPVYSSQTKNDGCLGYISTYDYDRSQLTWTTDGANAGTVFLREGKHNCTNVCGTLMPKNDNNNLKYLKYALEYIAVYHKRADINGYKIMNNEMADIVITLPPKCEQQKIAEYLDCKCTEIDAVIEKTKATIEEYKKLKQTIITEAVTKGVRVDRRMKNVDIELVDIIPEGWRYSPIKYVASFQPSCETSALSEDSEITYTPMDCIKNGYYIQNTAKYGAVTSSLTPYEEGDIVMAKVTPCFENGNIAIMENLASGFGMGSSELFVYRATGVNKRFLLYWLQNDKFKDDACATMTGTGGLKRVSPYYAKNAMMLLPPDEEQAEIVAFLDGKCAEVDRLIAAKEQLLTEMEAYKKSVIYEYVTGKKEVV